MRLIRRFFLFISIYLKRYRYLILASILVSIVFIFILRIFLSKIPPPKPKHYLGVVGSYSIQNLPPLIDDLLVAGLTKTGPNQLPLPNLSTHYDISDDGKQYTFYLQPNLTWPDGKKLQAADINLNIPKISLSYPDDQTVKFLLPETFAPFPSILTHAVFNSQGQTPTGYTATVTQSNSGSLKDIRLESAREIYIIKTYNSLPQAVIAFKLGQVDHLYHLNNQPDIKPNLSVSIKAETDYSHLVTLFFNTKDPLLTEKALRQAIAYLLQNKNFSKTKALSSIIPTSWAFNPLVKTYDYDTTRGIQLLKDNLPEDKQQPEFELSVLPEYLDTAENIKTELEKFSILLTVRVVTAVPENYQLFLGTLDIPPDPDQYSLWHSTQSTNITRLDDKKIDKLLEDGRTTIDQKERRLIYFDFQKSLLEELPAIFLYFPNRYQVSRGQPPL